MAAVEALNAIDRASSKKRKQSDSGDAQPRKKVDYQEEKRPPTTMNTPVRSQRSTASTRSRTSLPKRVSGHTKDDRNAVRIADPYEMPADNQPVAATAVAKRPPTVTRILRSRKPDPGPLKRSKEVNTAGSDAMLSSYTTPAKKSKMTRRNAANAGRQSKTVGQLEPMATSKTPNVPPLDTIQEPALTVEPQTSASSPELDETAETDGDARSPETQSERHGGGSLTSETDSDDGSQANPRPSKNRGKRKALTPEEREALKGQANLRRRAARDEAKRVEQQEAKTRGERFLRGIESIAAHSGMGDTKNWALMGSAAKLISTMVQKTNRMSNEQTQAVWDQLQLLHDGFGLLTNAPEDRINKTLGQLNSCRFTWIRSDKSSRNGTVVDLYERIVPRAVFVIKRQLLNRFQAEYEDCWEELVTLVQITRKLCDAAIEHVSDQVVLEAGIRSAVRYQIRPALDRIADAIKGHMRAAEDTRWRQEMRREYEAKLAMEFQHKSGISAPVSQRDRQRVASAVHMNRLDGIHDIDDIEDLDGSDHHHSQQKRPAHLSRKMTDDIPAPPDDPWTDDEDQALMNGLQVYTGHDRYVRLLTGRYKERLKGKNMDQCIARAKFWRASSSAELDLPSCAWLRSV